MARFQKGTEVVDITSSAGGYAGQQCKYLREGWTRVADPRCEVPLGAEPINATLEAALRADPQDQGAAVVYADWLLQHGHPRGALISVQHQLASNPRDAALIEAERTIIEDAGDALISRPLLAHFKLLRGRSEMALSQNLYEGGTIAFDHGFMREALVLVKQRGADEDLLWELLRHPSARVLAKLGVTVDRRREVALVAALITHGPRPPLRALSFRVEERTGVTDLSGLDTAYPLLEELELSLYSANIGALHLPKLRRLAVCVERGDLVRVLAASAWPALEVLSLTSALEHAPRTATLVDPNDLAAMLEQPRFPALRTLELGPSERGLELCRILARAPAAAHLEVLALPGVKLVPEAVTLLVEQRARFARLAVLRVDSVRSSEVDRLRDAGYPVQTSPAKKGTR